MSTKVVLAALITGIVTLGSSWFGYKHNTETLCEQTRQALSEEISTLRDRVFKEVDERKTLEYQVLSLRLKLEEKFDSSAMLKDYLDGKPWPAWTKVLEPETGRVVYWHINEAYEDTFNISNAFVKGKTDAEIQKDKKVAEEFLRNDLLVIKTKTGKCPVEHFPLDLSQPVSDDNPLVAGLLCKWWSIVENKDASNGEYIPESLW